MLNKFKENIFVISPHIDDAVFSLGGVMSTLSQKHKINVVNIFSKSNFSKDGLGELIKVSEERKNEDKLVSNDIGIKFSYLDIKEALLRGYNLENIFKEDTKNISDISVSKIIIRKLKKIISKNSTILFPSGFGGHIDHYIARIIGEELSNTGFDIYFYQELPYMLREKKSEDALKFLQKKQKIELRINKVNKNKHLELVKMYKSQVLDRHIKEIEFFLDKLNYIIWK